MNSALRIFIVTASLLLIPISGFSSETVTINAEDQLDLAQTLFQEKDFSASAHEYIRFYHLFPDHEKVPEAKYKAGLAFFKANMTKNAIRHLTKVAADYSDSGFAPDAMFYLSRIYLSKGRPDKAAGVLRNLITLTTDPQIHDTACYMLGWLLLEHSEELKSRHHFTVQPIKEAEKHFSMISTDGQKQMKITPLLASLKEIRHLKTKNPALSGVLSIIPGGGFLYCGRYRDALVSFLLNSTLILAAHKSFENDNPFLGSAIAFVETGFYAGNIYGSISSAHKHNKNQRKKIIRKLQQKYLFKKNNISFQPGVTTKGVALVLKYTF